MVIHLAKNKNFIHGVTRDKNGNFFLRRRSRPFLILLGILIIASLAICIRALSITTTVANATNCPSAPSEAVTASATNLQSVSHTELALEPPAALGAFTVRVLNATDQSGAAQRTLDELTNRGFIAAAERPTGDDPIYRDGTLDCFGQIRFGTDGTSAAASTSILLPCLELINDGRTGRTVDVVLGADYQSADPSQDAQVVLDTLRAADPRNPSTGVDMQLVSAIHQQSC